MIYVIQKIDKSWNTIEIMKEIDATTCKILIKNYKI
jgi:hypothetical protein